MSIQTVSLTTSLASVYVSTGNIAITSMTLCNWSPNTVLANLFVVPAGNTADTTNQMWYSLALPSGDTYQLYVAAEKLILSSGDSIQANCSNTGVSVITSYTSI